MLYKFYLCCERVKFLPGSPPLSLWLMVLDFKAELMDSGCQDLSSQVGPWGWARPSLGLEPLLETRGTSPLPNGGAGLRVGWMLVAAAAPFPAGSCLKPGGQTRPSPASTAERRGPGPALSAAQSRSGWSLPAGRLDGKEKNSRDSLIFTLFSQGVFLTL